MTLHADFADALELDGRPRFYPSGQHPATARQRAHLTILKSLPETPETKESIAHVERLLATFELGEDRAKAMHLRCTRGDA